MARQVAETETGAAQRAAPVSVSEYHNSTTQRSIQSGLTPTVIIRAGADITVEGWDGRRVVAETESRGGLKVGRRSETEFGRLRAAVGERVLLDLRAAGVLVHASSGGALDVQGQAVEGDDLKLEAGRDLRRHVGALDDARLLVSDLGGSWEGRIGAGRVTLRLKSGGDVTLVTDSEVLPQGPDFVIGRVEKPKE